MVGARFPEAAAVTVMVNAAREVVVLPSLTRITMPELTPAAVGVPDNLPVLVLKLAQPGLFEMVNPNESRSASLAVGWKLYAVPTATVVTGVPEITGARLVDVVEPERCHQ